MSAQQAMVDVSTFRNVFASVAGAVSVLTLGEGDKRTGLTATSVSAFSAEPPTVAILVNTSSSSWNAIQSEQRFCINILARDQEAVAHNFAGRGGLKGVERFAGAEWTTLQSGAPVLQGALANIDCLLDEAIVRHSHAIVLGRIVALRSNPAARPLLYWQRAFLGLDEMVQT